MIARSAALAAVLVVSFATSAHARPATSEEVRALAQRAQSDPSALADLQQIDSVDGARADLRSALAGASPSELQQRLGALSGSDADVQPSANARDEARSILEQRRYRDVRIPRPFAGPLRRLGDWLGAIGRAIGRFFARAVGLVPGPRWLKWTIFFTLAGALTAFVVWRIGRRRRFVEVEQHAAVRMKGLRPEDLERSARDAEAAGKYADAIRLRFLAGLLRLDHAGAIKWHPSMTAGKVKRSLRSPSFERVASSFELVAYGGRMPTEEDVELSRSGWREVLHER